MLLAGSSSCSRARVEQSDPITNEPSQSLSSYNQIIESDTKNLSVSTSQRFDIPVHIKNPGTDTWSSTGAAPVTISYKWFLNGEMLPIEGERTLLPEPIAPTGAADVTVHVVAPTETGKYELRVTLVHEGVTWFMTKSSNYLSLPISVH